MRTARPLPVMRKKLNKPDTSKFFLGQWVEFAFKLRRVSSYGSDYRGWRKEWVREKFDVNAQGIVMGIRHLSNGKNEWVQDDAPLSYTHTDYLVAILVSYDLKRKPVLVLPEDLVILDRGK